MNKSEDDYVFIRWHGATFRLNFEDSQWLCEYERKGISGSLRGPNGALILDEAVQIAGFSKETAHEIVLGLMGKMRERLFN